MELSQWLEFVIIWTLAGIPLGPNALNCINSSAQYGFYKSLYCVLGIVLAAMIYISIVFSGLVTLLLVNVELFQLIRYLGAAYLIWMGISMWRKPASVFNTTGTAQCKPALLIRNSLLISLSNPKAILSYSAVFSQFISLQANSATQNTILVATALCIVVSIYIGYCYLGSAVTRFLDTLKKRTLFNKGVGSAYVLAGLGLLASNAINKPQLGA